LHEKHKDYVLRARDYHRKEKTLHALRLKAALRNPDEFYHKMINTSTDHGIHQEQRDDEAFTEEETQLMRSQDVKYLQYRLSIEKQKIQQLQEGLRTNPTLSKHTIFVDDEEELQQFKVDEYFDTQPEIVNNAHFAHNRLTKEQLRSTRLSQGAGSMKQIRKQILLVFRVFFQAFL